MKKKLTYIFIVISVIILMFLGYIFIPNKENEEQETPKTIEEQTTEVMTIEEKTETKDENVIGYITIESIKLDKAPIADGTENKVINKYVGHFKETSYLDGNVALCSHNRGNYATYFENLKNIKKGDTITYITKNETKQYEVIEIKEIEETDLSVLEQTEENRITLITCIENKRAFRLCVIGTEINDMEVL